jgi:dihydrolipoamide dehydrogenase
MDSFDVAIIGAGPGGYVCAFRAAQLGLKVALIEKRPTLGGTCLNVGCIPSKALLQLSEHFAWAKNQAASSGIKLSGVELDLATLMKKKDGVVQKLVGGVAQLAKARQVTVFSGQATLAGNGVVTVAASSPGGAATEIAAKNIVIASGSVPTDLSFLPFDHQTVVSSDEAIAFDAVPRRLVVVGGGAIGLELGSVWSRLGSAVTVVEFLPKIAASYDDDVVRLLARLLAKQGLKIEVNTRITGLKEPAPSPSAPGTGSAVLLAERDGKPLEFPADKILVSVGRRPVTENLGIEKLGLQLDEKKLICARPSPESGRSAMSSPARCWRTRPRRTVPRSPSGSRATLDKSTGTWCRRSSTPIPRWRRSASARTAPRRKASTCASGSSSSPPMDGPLPPTPPTVS